MELKFTVREYSGMEIYLYEPEQNDSVDETKLKVIAKEDPIEKGMQVLVPSLFGGGFHIMTVARDEYGELYLDGGALIGILNFCQDRQVWVCGGLINKKCIDNLKIHSSGSTNT